MIISWPLHLERRLRLVPRAEADFKHLVAALAKGGLICAANPGLLRLGDEKREALINCVWWGVCKCVYWKIGSVIVTTLATASYFVGSADTKVNKQTKKKMQNLLRKVFKRALNQIRTWLSGLRKHRQTTAGEGHRGCQAVQQPVGALTQILLHLPDKQPENGLHLGGRQSQSEAFKLSLLSTVSGSDLFCGPKVDLKCKV